VSARLRCVISSPMCVRRSNRTPTPQQLTRSRYWQPRSSCPSVESAIHICWSTVSATLSAPTDRGSCSACSHGPRASASSEPRSSTLLLVGLCVLPTKYLAFPAACLGGLIMRVHLSAVLLFTSCWFGGYADTDDLPGQSYIRDLGRARYSALSTGSAMRPLGCGQRSLVLIQMDWNAQHSCTDLRHRYAKEPWKLRVPLACLAVWRLAVVAEAAVRDRSGCRSGYHCTVALPIRPDRRASELAGNVP
jgi:hypothetical protein